MFNIISFFGILLSIIILVFLRQDNKQNIYLSGFYFILSLIALSNFYVFLDTSNYSFLYFFYLIHPFLYCSGPFLFLFIKKTFEDAGDQSSKTFEYLYFLPVIIVFINFSPQYFLSFEEHALFHRELRNNPFSVFDSKYLVFSLKINLLLRSLWNLFLVVACSLLLLKNTKRDAFFQLANVSNIFIFLLILFFLFHTLTFLFFSVSLITENINNLKNLDLTTQGSIKIFSGINLFILLIIFLFPKTLFGISRFNKIFNFGTIVNFENPDFQGGEKPEEAFKIISEKLKAYFEAKPFLEKNFSISTISKDTHIPYNQISLFFQVYLKISFSDWKNSERINYAKDLFISGQAKKFTIEAIALRCGYLSRSNFIITFKKHVGVSPSVFIKNLPKKSFVSSSNKCNFLL